MSHHHGLGRSETWALRTVFALVLLSLVVVFTGRMTGKGLQARTEPELVESRLVVFADTADGGVSIRDAESGEEVALYGSGDGGFARTALRALNYSRRLHEVGAEAPFVIGKAADGRVVLKDPSTGKAIGLDAFGDGNARQFAFLLDTEGAPE